MGNTERVYVSEAELFQLRQNTANTREWIGTILIKITRVTQLPPFIFPNGLGGGVSGYDFRLHTTKQQQNAGELQCQNTPGVSRVRVSAVIR